MENIGKGDESPTEESEYDKNWWVTEAMRRYGGSFVKELGKLCRHADRQNTAKLKATFPEYWGKYSALVDKAKRAVAEEEREIK